MRAQMLMLQIKAGLFLEKAKNALFNRRGEGFVDTAVKILISVVVGALVLAGLYLLFKNLILPTLSDRIRDMFNYEG
jgi:hypothetical protein